MNAFQEWSELVSAPYQAERRGSEVDWSALPMALPPDYRAYIDRYGLGWVNRLFVVLSPAADKPHLELFASAREHARAIDEILAELDGNSEDWRRPLVNDPPYPLGVGPDRLMMCAVTETQDVLYWHTVGDDPAAWPLYFRDDDGTVWDRYELSLVGFLLAVFRGEIDPRGWDEAGYLDPPVFDPAPFSRR